MIRSTGAGLAAIAALALLAAPAGAQSETGLPKTQSNGTAEVGASENAQGIPTPADPAATETPEYPAASGGEASDATATGSPAGSATSATGANRADSEPRAMPSNEVGEKFELPRVSGDDQIELIAGLCGVQMKEMTPAACKCLASEAMSELSDPQRDYLIASVVAPPVADRMLKDRRVGAADQKTIFAFLNTTSDACRTGKLVPSAEAPAPAK
ncbi:MAG TPA: hypothetical protein VIN77_07980 [Aurantimonas sp.]